VVGFFFLEKKARALLYHISGRRRMFVTMVVVTEHKDELKAHMDTNHHETCEWAAPSQALSRRAISSLISCITRAGVAVFL
jgi:hypothetical protein